MNKTKQIFGHISISDPIISVQIPCQCVDFARENRRAGKKNAGWEELKPECEQVYEQTDFCLTKYKAIKNAKAQGWKTLKCKDGKWYWISSECYPEIIGKEQVKA